MTLAVFGLLLRISTMMNNNNNVVRSGIGDNIHGV